MRPASPCIAVCVLDPASGYCRGCARTVEEIANWLRYTPAECEAVWARLPARRARIDAENPRAEPG